MECTNFKEPIQPLKKAKSRDITPLFDKIVVDVQNNPELLERGD